MEELRQFLIVGSGGSICQNKNVGEWEMLRMLKKYETALAEVTYMLECGWEVVESDEWGYWLTKEI